MFCTLYLCAVLRFSSHPRPPNIGQPLPSRFPSYHRPTVGEQLPHSRRPRPAIAYQPRTGRDAGQKTPLDALQTSSRPRDAVPGSPLHHATYCHDRGLHGYVVQRVRGHLALSHFQKRSDGLAKWAIGQSLCCQLDAQTL